MTAMDAREVGRPSAKRGTRDDYRKGGNDSLGPGEGCLPWIGRWMRRLFWFAVVIGVLLVILAAL